MIKVWEILAIISKKLPKHGPKTSFTILKSLVHVIITKKCVLYLFLHKIYFFIK